jgi:uncharacterized membrane protein YbaN (DUF454 family)
LREAKKRTIIFAEDSSMTNTFSHFIQEWKSKNPKEKCFMLLGALFLVFAIVGVFLPLVPQVPFAIISAMFFSKGSPRIHQWIRNNKHMGRPVRDWEDHKVVRTKLKLLSITMMICGALLGHWKLLPGWAIAFDVVFLACIIFVATRKSKP